MTIHQPGRRLWQTIPLHFVQKKARGARRDVNPRLSTTSMIDFLVVTVVFLLMTFDASGDCCLQKKLLVPSAENVEDLVDAPMVVVTKTMILTDGAPTGDTRILEASQRVQRIDETWLCLKSIRDRWKQINPGKAFPGAVLLKIDQDVQAVAVKSIVRTAALAGYPNVSFAVNPLAARSLHMR